jgi:peptidoglycan-associated lipoprotein
MQKAAMALAAVLLLLLAQPAWAQWAQAAPGTVNLRFDEQISSGPAGLCGCFGLEGVAADAGWRLPAVRMGTRIDAGLAADFGVVHTGNEDGTPYGLTLTTLAAGPRFNLAAQRLAPFVQALFGFAHGSGSAFPQGNSLTASASSFALDIGGGADYPLRERLSVRLLQLDYLRTWLPNSRTDWQNNLRIGVGITLRFEGAAKH